MNKYICVHGHFYQPPRENPWLEEVELQDSAYPFHDWNKRITIECYAPNAASRILDNEDKIVDIVNNYAQISFNFGPTLLSWMQRHMNDTYNMILEADKLSLKNFSGHGSALAQVYNHMIMPLSNLKDKQTQVIWGIKDFVARFKRKPEGMWLAETAVDTETLEVLAEHDIKFTILSPYQAQNLRKIGDEKWIDASAGKIDPKMPYLCNLPSGKKITLFFYDGPVSQDIAFGGLLDKGENLANRLIGTFGSQEEPQLVHIATDGETYGHHHSYGEMALSYGYNHIKENKSANITIYGEYLEKFPPTHEVQIAENSSWSCIHGVERWRNDCGCKIGSGHNWNQAWRAPLRKAMDWLRDALIEVYEKEGAKYLKDVWQARDGYIEVILNREDKSVKDFLQKHANAELPEEDKIQALKLLEMQRHAMLMYTSCGWFFDEISGIETVQIMQYAARAIQMAKEAGGIDLEPGYLKILKKAHSNIKESENGAKIYEKAIKQTVLDLHRVGAHFAVSSLFNDYPKTTKVYCYSVENRVNERAEAGRQKIVIGRALVKSDITYEEDLVSFAALHMGDHNLFGGVRDYMGEEPFDKMQEEIKGAFQRSDISQIIHLIDQHFGSHNYSLWHLFKDEQRKVLDEILNSTLEEIENSFRQINEHHYPVMQVIKEIDMPLPKILSTTLEFMFNADIRKILDSDEIDLSRLQNLVEEVKRWSFVLDTTTIKYVASKRITILMKQLDKNPGDLKLITTLGALFKCLSGLNLDLSLWRAQNIYFDIHAQLYAELDKKSREKDRHARKWIRQFDRLGKYLRVRSR
ncbi:MAG: DUF3536 domain-containing protein [PVC group bacterium]|nr:DUF3536 domain-containing protein [PVC group bacterium]